ncbi:MAG: Type 1 glutamine amidotransferase-like domain-containing protein [Planctomycetales bacterium]|nr:Type 1 glutamine amidotransferase-like domain-containing protein [Planctomycetales bacterium]
MMLRFLILISVLACPVVVVAQVFDEEFEHWPIDLRIHGRLLVAGRLEDPTILQRALRRVPRGSTTLLFDDHVPDATIAQYQRLFRDDVPSIPEGSEKTPDYLADKSATQPVLTVIRSGGVTEQIGELLTESDVFVWHASPDATPADRTAQLEQPPAFADYLARGKTLVLIGSVAELSAKYFYAELTANPPEVVGLNLLTDCVLETGYQFDAANQSRLLSILAAHPRSVGIGLNDNTVLTLSGRRLSVTGTGGAMCLLLANERESIRSQTIFESRSRRQSEASTVVDLTQWRREAIDRTLPAFPPAEPAKPLLENGTLVIVGGGRTPPGLMERLVDLAGGPKEARMVYIPCSEDEEVSSKQQTVESWKRMGVAHATFIHTKDRHKANHDEEFLAPLKDATGLWFGGGRQWNFSDSYYGTKAHELMKHVLRRGGVIGGSSAGASIQARYLARATPIENIDIMAPGYERGGLGFIDGVAIDQHFSQRGRQKNMTLLVNRHPQLLGIGIDEATAIVVQKSIAEVIGQGRVYFYDRNLPVYPDRPDYIALPAGSTFDLSERRVLSDASETPIPETTEMP